MAMRDPEGQALSSAHLLGFLWRILKLLYYGILPVFVFDGGAPVLKRKTIASRKSAKEGARETHARTAEKLLAAQLRAAAVAHVQGRPAAPPRTIRDPHKDPYMLPAVAETPIPEKDLRYATDDELRALMNSIAPEDLDINSEFFRSLPPELQYELVGDLRLQSRGTSYSRLQAMLASAPTPIDFSRAQVAGLKTRNDLTQKVLTVTDEIGHANIQVPLRVAGARNKEYVLIRNPTGEGGFALALRDAGVSRAKAIDVDAREATVLPQPDDDDIPLEEVEIPAHERDPELDELVAVDDPHVRKERALALLSARAQQHAHQVRIDTGIDAQEERLYGRASAPAGGGLFHDSEDELEMEEVDIQAHSDLVHTSHESTPAELTRDLPGADAAADRLSAGPMEELVEIPAPPPAAESIVAPPTEMRQREASPLPAAISEPGSPQMQETAAISSPQPTPEPDITSVEPEAAEPHAPDTPLDAPAAPSRKLTTPSPLNPETPTSPPSPPSLPAKRERSATPLDWSPSPEPVGADGFPLPSAAQVEEEEAREEQDMAAMDGDQSEFATFVSATSGRDLGEMQAEVAAEVDSLRAEHARTRRSEEDITHQMTSEVQILLGLFGIPYVTAPMEAEAQCAELTQQGLVDGIITDDSDVFLFGGTPIYRNMFNARREVESYYLRDVQRELGLDRDRLIELALLLGSDYTEGLSGVGPVLAMEILSLYSGNGGLEAFREWWKQVQRGAEPHDGNKIRRRIKRALRDRVHLDDGWPDENVRNAYVHPQVDASDEHFVWGHADLDGLRAFLREFLGWATQKTDEYVMPVIEQQRKTARLKRLQTTLDEAGFVSGQLRVQSAGSYSSTRLQQVVRDFRNASREAESENATAPRRAPRTKRARNAPSGRSAHLH